MTPMPRAIVMRRTGGPEVLTVEEVPLVALRPDEVRVRSLACAVNFSDLQMAWRSSVR